MLDNCYGYLYLKEKRIVWKPHKWTRSPDSTWIKICKARKMFKAASHTQTQRNSTATKLSYGTFGQNHRPFQPGSFLWRKFPHLLTKFFDWGEVQRFSQGFHSSSCTSSEVLFEHRVVTPHFSCTQSLFSDSYPQSSHCFWDFSVAFECFSNFSEASVSNGFTDCCCWK